MSMLGCSALIVGAAAGGAVAGDLVYRAVDGLGALRARKKRRAQVSGQLLVDERLDRIIAAACEARGWNAECWLRAAVDELLQEYQPDVEELTEGDGQ